MPIDTEKFIAAIRRLDIAATEATKAANGMRRGESGCNKEVAAAKDALALMVLGRKLTVEEQNV